MTPLAQFPLNRNGFWNIWRVLIRQKNAITRTDPLSIHYYQYLMTAISTNNNSIFLTKQNYDVNKVHSEFAKFSDNSREIPTSYLFDSRKIPIEVCFLVLGLIAIVLDM